MFDFLRAFAGQPSCAAALVGLGAIAMMSPARAAEPPVNPRELGAISWQRDFNSAIAEARRSNRPLLILFDEVPGCQTCQGYGQLVLSHPLIVEAAESLFVRAAVFNNIEGPDRAVLRSFHEQEWNNPVVRIINADRKELAPRITDDYSVGALAAGMATALSAPGERAPEYLRLLTSEGRSGLDHAAFAMGCFWVGEAALGGLAGVTSTRTGILDDREVVEVEFDPSILPYDALLKASQSLSCADRVYTRSAAQDKAARAVVGDKAVRTDAFIRPTPDDDKHSLVRSPWRFVPMTSAQTSRVNAAVARGEDPATVLSPQQLAIARRAIDNPEAPWPVALNNPDFATAFAQASAVARKFGPLAASPR